MTPFFLSMYGKDFCSQCSLWQREKENSAHEKQEEFFDVSEQFGF